MSKALFITFLIVMAIALGGVLTFAMGMALLAFFPALILLGPPLFFLSRLQKSEQHTADEAMRAADAERTPVK